MITPEIINRICNDKYSYMNPDRLAFLAMICQEKALPAEGAIVECGVCNGGSLACVAYDNNRQVWGFDSWEGCPAPTDKDTGCYESVHPETGICAGKIDRVNELMTLLNIDRNRVTLVSGWVGDTIKQYKEKIGKIAFLHIDVDYYEPTKLVLESLYDQIVEDGAIFCGDYGYWMGANRAIHEFIVDKPITLERPFKNGVFWRKSKWRSL